MIDTSVKTYIKMCDYPEKIQEICSCRAMNKTTYFFYYWDRIVALLVTIFIILKFLDKITWTWVWVLSPLWVSAIIATALLLVAMVVFFFEEKGHG